MLAHLVNSCVPHQVPFGFNLNPLSTKISSWVTCLLLNQPLTTQWSKGPMRSKISLGNGTSIISSWLDLFMTLSISTPSQEDRSTGSLVHLLHHCNRVDFILNKIFIQKQLPSEPPWIAWHRSLSWLTDLTPGWTQMPKLYSFYKCNFGHTQTLTTRK